MFVCSVCTIQCSLSVSRESMSILLTSIVFAMKWDVTFNFLTSALSGFHWVNSMGITTSKIGQLYEWLPSSPFWQNVRINALKYFNFIVSFRLDFPNNTVCLIQAPNPSQVRPWILYIIFCTDSEDTIYFYVILVNGNGSGLCSL